jgi:hypothetical protein
LDVAEFERILRIGLGRAVLHLQNHDSAPYRDVILHACLYHTSYDPQVEIIRALYLFDVISLTNERAFYVEQILKRLLKISPDENPDHIRHIFQMAERLAGRGNKKARRLMYAKLKEILQAGHFPGALELVRVDGLKAYLFIVANLPETLFVEDHREHGSLYSEMQEQYGKAEFSALLEEQFETNTRLKSYIEAFLDRRNQPRKSNRPDYKSDYKVIKAWIESLNERERVVSWGPSKEDLELAAQDFLSMDESKRAQLLTYLNIFKNIPFPLHPSKLISLVDHSDEEIASTTLRALQHVNHIEVRELAIRMIESSDRVGEASRLLVLNYQEGDWLLLDRITQQPLTPDDYHQIGFTVTDLCEENYTVNAVSALLNVYERLPCSYCREFLVKTLHERDILPNWMLEECKYDANLDLRDAARRNFEPK